jgi:hypothetical protein
MTNVVIFPLTLRDWWYKLNTVLGAAPRGPAVPRQHSNCGFAYGLGRIPAARGPGFTLVSFARHPVTGQKDTASIPCAFRIQNRFLRGKSRAFICVRIPAACCTCGFFALDAAKIPDYRATRTPGTNGDLHVKSRFLGSYARSATNR